MEVRIFSGMGNSLAVGSRLRSLLADDTSDDLLWVFPVYSWGIPPVLVRHISNLDLRGRRCHMVCTFGDEAGRTDRQWHSLIESHGGVCGCIYGIQMPNTYVCLPFFNVDSTSVTEAKLKAATDRVKAIASSLLANRDNQVIDLHFGPMAAFKSRVIYPFFFRWLEKSSRFHHTPACTSCGLCIKHCPVSNLTPDDDGAPVWGDNCAFCLRCYHACPHHAVAYGRQTRGKGQYLHPDFYKLLK